MESAILCTKKRTATSATEDVSCHVTHFTTTDLGCETFYYSGFSAENTPIKYTDPDGRIIDWVQGEGVSDAAFAKAKAAGEELKASGTEAGRRFSDLDDRTDIVVTINVNKHVSNDAMATDNYSANDRTGSDTIVNINIKTKRLGLFGKKIDLAGILAHEVSGHAYSNADGKNPIKPGTDPGLVWIYKSIEEQNASAIENEWRDFKGLSQRKYYEWPSVPAPQYNNSTGTWSVKDSTRKPSKYKVY
jgi:hypothetical protein